MPFDISNWMGLVGDAKKLSELSIPGTHDSGARYIDPTVYKLRKSPRLTTQTAGIREQLDAGIRFLDIRVGYTKGRFLLYHEDAFENLGFADVRNICSEFLTAHPKETIILSLKKEDDAPDGGNPKDGTFQGRFNEFVKTSRTGLWYLQNAIPTLKEVRGKIVLYRRFALDKGTTTLGINAFDKYTTADGGATFTLESPPTRPKLRIQDEYGQLSTSKASKKAAIEKVFVEALLPGHENVLYVNFTSAAGVVPVDFPLSVANYINPWLITYLNGHAKGRLGIVAMDFQTVELNTLIARTNPGVG
jgi:1-phosphatidylinositol phosphodiesterase